ncbi:MAG: TIGR01212 family radical SAM protein [Planctomycetota bacterium]|nr:MAG: TIGR01212 family radical SAM protein [Planctomycetota bacterium]
MDQSFRYLSFGRYLRGRFGRPVHKISIHAGFTCPNRDGTIGTTGCIYCDNRSFSPASNNPGLGQKIKPIREQIEQAKVFLSERYGADRFIAYFQSYTNTHAPVEVLRRRYGEALEDPDVIGIAIGTRPDCVDDEKLDLISDIARTHHTWVEYGLQTANDETLEAVNRGHDVAAFDRAVSETRGRGLLVCAHVIFGLPGDTREDMLDTIRHCVGAGVEGIKFHQLHVIRDTPLAELWEKGEVPLLDFETYLDLVVESIELLPPGTVVHRLFGTGPKELWLGPNWNMRPQEIQLAIERELEKRDTYQGRKKV